MANTRSAVPGYVWFGGIDGRRVAVPRRCPECGRPTARRGNRHHREVLCSGQFERTGSEYTSGGVTMRLMACRWRATVCYGEPDGPAPWDDEDTAEDRALDALVALAHFKNGPDGHTLLNDDPSVLTAEDIAAIEAIDIEDIIRRGSKSDG